MWPSLSPDVKAASFVSAFLVPTQAEQNTFLTLAAPITNLTNFINSQQGSPQPVPLQYLGPSIVSAVVKQSTEKQLAKLQKAFIICRTKLNS